MSPYSELMAALRKTGEMDTVAPVVAIIDYRDFDTIRDALDYASEYHDYHEVRDEFRQLRDRVENLVVNWHKAMAGPPPSY